ncbi:MAG: dipeptide epimerase [Myxococcota bacterium]
MKIVRVDVERESIPLTKPYTVAYGTKDTQELLFARIETDVGHVGYGSGSPSKPVTGEDFDESFGALTDGRLSALVGRDPRAVGTLLDVLRQGFRERPAALATVEIALWDCFGKACGLPLVDILGRRHQGLPTSVTIGISPLGETLADAREHLAKGFRCLKLKIGHDLEADLERITKLRELAGPATLIRVDANQGYSAAETIRLVNETRDQSIEFIEQPLPPSGDSEVRAMPDSVRERLALDESVQTPEDAWRLCQPEPASGVINIKLMKSGGVAAGRQIAEIAGLANRSLMWGCMDESAISIAAALHAAYSSGSTRFLDLDGSFDLARDPARGGFRVTDGCLYLTDEPGLGVTVDWPG